MKRMKQGNVKLLLIIIMNGYIGMLWAEKPIPNDEEYAIFKPTGFENETKKYPLIICYKSTVSDSLLSSFSTSNQIIVLQFNNSPTVSSDPDYIKKIILKIKKEYSVARDKIFLLGINQNIQETIKTKKDLPYYFAATAFIASKSSRYNNSIRETNRTKIFYYDTINSNALNSVYTFFHQYRLWEVDISRISEDEFGLFGKPNNKNKWQISINYGQMFFNNSSISNENRLLKTPGNMGAWDFSFARYFKESLSVNVKLGLQFKKISPEYDRDSILNGADIDIEGGGFSFIPLSIGLDYIFIKKRFRPYAGFNIGIVSASYKNVVAKGNINDGIDQTEKRNSSNAPFIEISSGFNYRMSDKVQLNVFMDYVRSSDFDIKIGGYKGYNGLKIAVGMSILF